jgi:hypothetical protein
VADGISRFLSPRFNSKNTILKHFFVAVAIVEHAQTVQRSDGKKNKVLHCVVVAIASQKLMIVIKTNDIVATPERHCGTTQQRTIDH